VAHSILVACWHILSKATPYEDLGDDWFIRRRPEAHARRLAKHIEALGFDVTVTLAKAAS
jgi:transposase